MKRIHLLRFEGAPEALAGLFAAVRAEGLRAGWLDLGAAEPDASHTDSAGTSGAGEAGSPTGGPGVDSAVTAGAFRAAAVAPGRVVSVKAVTGPPVLRDLLREHFLGCALVVVRPGGEGSAFEAELGEVPALEAVGGRFRVTPPGQAALDLSPEELAARLRRPRPWG